MFTFRNKGPRHFYVEDRSTIGENVRGITPSLRSRVRTYPIETKTRLFSLVFVSRRERDGTTISLRSLLPSRHPSSLRERDWTSTSLRLSMPSRLRPLAVILDCVWFASLSRSQSNPLRGFEPCPIETKSGALRLHFLFQGERGIRTLGPVTVSGFRDRPNRPLWHLSKVRIM